jgi:hypothetical protein
MTRITQPSDLKAQALINNPENCKLKLLLISILYKLKAKYPKIWSVIESLNSQLFGIFYARSIKAKLHHNLLQTNDKALYFRFLTSNDTTNLLQLLNTLETELSGYFEPHDFTPKAINHQLKNNAFFMMGAFNENTLVGYFFIRAGINKKCFVGRLIHKDYRSCGIGRKMNQIMYQSAWSAGFRIFATLSPNNKLVMQSHKNNPNMKVLKNLPDNYLLVEFVKPERITKTH